MTTVGHREPSGSIAVRGGVVAALVHILLNLEERLDLPGGDVVMVHRGARVVREEQAGGKDIVADAHRRSGREPRCQHRGPTATLVVSAPAHGSSQNGQFQTIPMVYRLDIVDADFVVPRSSPPANPCYAPVMRRGQSTIEYMLTISTISIAIVAIVWSLCGTLQTSTESLGASLVTSLTTGGVQP